ncbi:hypothetical protein [Thiomicrospira microaerophila]|uniref:hypothetical protein n=1 Tax=Thiomicrospira microaerophila TaxID=406020 RepID=UPI0005CA2A52|nr:hypothetical protein [Thiomicrospira microaerophila]
MSIAVGKIINATGRVQVLNPETNEIREIENGQEIFFNEVVITADEASLAIDMIDGQTISLGACRTNQTIIC